MAWAIRIKGRCLSVRLDSPWSPQIHRQADGAVAELLPLGRDRDNVRYEQLRDVALVVLMDLDRRVEPALAAADGRLRLDDHEREAVYQQDEIGPLLARAGAVGELGGDDVLIALEVLEVN